MANTPFELYEEAYRLHYREKNVPGAVKIYEAIVRDFPDAHECGYAFIQLQKIKANETTAHLLNEKGGRLNSLMIPALAVSCIALLVACVGLVMTFRALHAEHDRSTLAIAALARIADGKPWEAEALIDKIRVMSPGDELVRELAAASKPRISSSETTHSEVNLAADTTAGGGAFALGEMKKTAGHPKVGKIRGVRQFPRIESLQTAIPNSDTVKF